MFFELCEKLCLKNGNPHHAAQAQATKLNEIAEKMNQDWLSLYGGKISSEGWLTYTIELK